MLAPGRAALRLAAALLQAGGLPASPCCTLRPPTSTVPVSAACTTARASSSRGGRRGTGDPPGRRPLTVVSTASPGILWLRLASL